MSDCFTDDDYITFGKYSSPPTKMKDVPASYLLWLWNNGMWRGNRRGDANDPVRNYIIQNFNHLTTECPDTIIDHHP